MSATISVVGTGYVGLVTGVVLAHIGHRVICVDCDPRKLEILERGESPIFEPGLHELLKTTIASGRLTFGDSIGAAVHTSTFVFIAAGTPSLPDGSPDMSAIDAIAVEIGQAIDKYTIVVNKSTVPVGSGERVAEIIRGQGVSTAEFDVVSNPEFLREGSAIKDALEADRIVVGAQNAAAANAVGDLYAPLGTVIFKTDTESAELIKYASNSYLAMKISFINAISRICELSGANVDDVATGMGLDSRIGPSFLSAGLGWGGSCFPKDVHGLLTISDQLGYRFRLLEEVDAINDNQSERFLDRISQRLGGFAGKRVCLLGLAFKPNTDDIRDSKSLAIIERILREGASVHAFDPVAMPAVARLHPEVRLAEDAYEAANDADALVLVTEWKEFLDLDLERIAGSMKTPVLFDGRRLFSARTAIDAGLEYHTIGERQVFIENRASIAA